MSLNTKNQPRSKSNYVPMDAGAYPGRTLHIVDLGLQAQRPFKGEAKDPANEILINYELLDEFLLDEDGNEQEDKPRIISDRMPIYSLEADRAKSTKRYYALDPKGEYDGDFEKLINIPCMVTVTQSQGKGQNAGKVYNNVGDVSPMRDKDRKNAKPLVNKPLVFSLDNAIENVAVFDALPQWIQDVIKEGLNFEGSDFAEFLEERPEPSTTEKDRDEDVEENNDAEDDEKDW